MKKIDLNENEVVFAPKGGKPGYIINGKWFPVDEKDYNTPALQKELERYARLRGQEQLKKDQESLKSQSSQSTQPPKPQFADLRGGDGKTKYGDGTPINPKPTPPVVPLEVEPASTSIPTTPPTPTPPTPAKTYKVDGEDMTAERIRQEYDKRRYSTDPAVKATASGFGDRANRAVFPNQRLTRRMKNVATGDYNPRQPIMNAYDLVLDYLLSEGHVDTVEEAHYVMLQMTSEHVQQVVEERTAADPKMKARMGYSNPAINGKPVRYPEGHPKAGEFMSFNKAETDGVNEYRRASKKAGRKIYADEPLPKK